MSPYRKSWRAKAKTLFQTPKLRESNLFKTKVSSQSPRCPSPAPVSDQLQEEVRPQVHSKDVIPIDLPSSQYRTNTFCPICSKFLHKLSVILSQTETQIRSTDFQTFQTHDTVENLLYWADKQCHLCSLVLGTAWLDGQRTISEARERLLNSYAAKNPPLTFRIHGNNHPTHENSSRQYGYSAAPDAAVLSLDVGLGTGAMVSIIPTEPTTLCHWRGTHIAVQPSERQPLCGSTGGAESLDLAKSWLEKCRKEHEQCGAASASAMKVRPARLLQLNGDQAAPKALLVGLEESDDAPEYLALSYSWGPKSAESTRLLVSNITSFSTTGIPFQILPPTIQDAITTTMTLGFRFLWIDALCIIQDSPNKADWNAEGGKMGAIYRNAACTIAALGSRGNHERLFRMRNPLCDRPCQVPNTGGKWQISNTAHYFFREFESYGPPAAPLHSRAWVVQERFSSIRTIFFGESGLFWECIQVVASESDPDGLLDPPNVNFKHHINEVLRPEQERVDRYIAFRSLWPTVLEQYMSCNLTYESDKLPGIKGISNLVGDAMGWMQYQGLWVNILSLDMAWMSNVRGNLKDFEKGGRAGFKAPSWSWASVRQSVTTAVNFEKYTITSSGSMAPEIVGYPNPGGVPLVDVEGLPRTIATALERRPEDSVSLMTDLKKVWIIHATRSWSSGALLTLQEPRERQVWEEIETHEMREGRETDDVVQEWGWTPDVPLDKSLTTAWFMNLLQIESKAKKKTGIIGLILKEVDLPRRVFERIGILKHTVYQPEEAIANDELSINGDTNPFARTRGIVRLVHII